RVRMMDFGLARRGAGLAAEEGDTQDVSAGARAMLRIEMTQAGAMVGTPAYMAPEQFAGQVPGPAADVFGFCVMLWEGLHGARPFAGQTVAELRANILAERRLAPGRSSGAPRWLLRVLVRGLAAEPARRWPTMGALLAELDRGHARRRRWQVGAAALGVVAAVGGGLGARELTRRQAIAACEAEGAAIAGDWNDEVRAGLGRAFLATGKPAAATSLEKTLPWLAGWASAWQAARASACEAHGRREGWDDELYARAVDCLAEARGSFTALVHELGAADAITVVRATAAAAGLSRADRCLDVAVLRARPPLAPEHAEAVQQVRAGLARVGSLRAAGNFAAGLALAEATLLAAREVDWPAVVAEGEYRVGVLAGDQGEYARAEASLLRALARAREAQAPRLAVDAMIHLVWIVGDRSARAAEGKVWAESAQTGLTLLLADDVLAQAQLDNNLGLVHHFSGGYDEAARLHARALAGWTAALGEQHPQVAQSLNNLANSRAGQGATEAAIGLHERALAIREVALGPEHPQVAASLSNLGIAYLKLDRFDQALRVQTRALAIREAALAPDHPDLIESLNNLANVHDQVKDHAAALPYYRRALAILERDPAANPRMLATVLYNCANIDEAQGDYAEAARKHERSLASFAALLGADHPNLTYPLEGLADVRLKLGDLDEALRLRLRALAIREQARGEDHPELAASLTGLARVQRARGALAEALALDTRARGILEAAGEAPSELAVPLLGLAETHLLARRPAAAVASLELALPLLGAGDEQRERLARVRFALARALWEARGDRARARALAEQAREGLAAAPTPGEALQEVDAWIASHRE
ncbi:MAG: tetratricopeptide repeat protein, partial [Myxococcales bacterium]|nr:tetratricopeptide repeat protein [Myxococcales bacterium]